MTSNIWPLVQGCRAILVSRLPVFLQPWFGLFDDALYQSADKSENALSSSYFDALRGIRMARAAMEARFSQTLLERFDHFWQHPPKPVNPSLDEKTAPLAAVNSRFSLVSNDALEEDLAVKTLAHRIDGECQEALTGLSQRFARMVGVSVEILNNTGNPIAPLAMAEALQTAFVVVRNEVPLRVLLMGYKLFEREAPLALDRLYGEINDALARQGILPQAPIARPTQTQERAGTTPSAIPAKVETGQPPTDSDKETRAEDFFIEMREILKLARAGGLLASGTQEGGTVLLPAVATTELLGSLSALQQSLDALGSAGGGQGLDLHHALKERLGLETDGQAQREIRSADQDTIDFVSVLFEFILEDRQLPDAMKVLIARLQIPIIKVAILDRGFFSKKLHPARRLLNNLAKLAMSWSDDGDRGPQGVYGKIDTLVNRIVTDFHDEVGLFSQTNEELEGFIATEENRAKAMEARTAETVKGQDQRRAARLVVERLLSEKLGHRELPEAAQTLLDGWRDLMILTYLRQGQESEGFQQQGLWLDEFLWSLRPKDAASRPDLLRAIPQILRRLRDELLGIGYDQAKLTRLLKDLQVYYVVNLRQADEPRPSGASEVRASPPPAAVGAEEAHPLANKRFVDQVQQMATGTWLELTAVNGQKHRVKFSWRSAVTDTLVFVNRKGIKVLEASLQEVALRLQQGTLQTISDTDTPYMERMMGSLAQSLRPDSA
ncbi:MAG: DUF1631 domain-containing protein [Pseudomonadota bacterium]